MLFTVNETNKVGGCQKVSSAQILNGTITWRVGKMSLSKQTLLRPFIGHYMEQDVAESNEMDTQSKVGSFYAP